VISGGQRVSGAGLGQFGHSADVTRPNLRRGLLRLSSDEIHLPDPLRLASGAVQYLRVRPERPSVDPEVAEFAHIRIGHRLEDLGGQGRIRAHGHLHGRLFGIHPGDVGAL
jgi:hypothetical protein